MAEGESPPLTLREADVTSELCQRCARCCDIEIALKSLDSRTRCYIRGVGYGLSPEATDGKPDCCDSEHEATLLLGPCRHLLALDPDENESRLFACALAGEARRPQMCADYNCVSWAKTNNKYNRDNSILVAAQRAFDELAAAAARSH